MRDVHLLRPDGVAYCGIRRWALTRLDAKTTTDADADDLCVRCESGKRSADRWNGRTRTRTGVQGEKPEEAGHVVYPRFGDGGPEKLPQPGERINDPDSVLHGFFAAPKCHDCGEAAYTKEQGMWRCPPCRKSWLAECAGYSRGLKGKPPEQDDSAYMKGWHAGATRWKASARYTSRGYQTP